MANNKRCDSLCNTLDCNYDNGECVVDCSPGCKSTMRGDGICQSACFTPACNSDNFDCAAYCNIGCLKSSLGNGKCEKACYTETCQFDLGDCEHNVSAMQCTPLCFPETMGDGTCNPECDLKQCGFDSNDCVQYVWIDSKAIDGGSGSASAPFNTLGASFRHTYSGKKAEIKIKPGVYWLESQTWPSNGVEYLTFSCTGELGDCFIQTSSYEAAYSFNNFTELSFEKLQFVGLKEYDPECSSLDCITCYKYSCSNDSCQMSAGEFITEPLDMCSNINGLCLSPRKAIISIAGGMAVEMKDIIFSQFYLLVSAVSFEKSNATLTNILGEDLFLIGPFIAYSDTSSLNTFITQSCGSAEQKLRTGELEGSLVVTDSELRRVNMRTLANFPLCRDAEFAPAFISAARLKSLSVDSCKIDQFSSSLELKLDRIGLIDAYHVHQASVTNLSISKSLLITPAVKVFLLPPTKVKASLVISELSLKDSVTIRRPVLDIQSPDYLFPVTLSDIKLESVSLLYEVVAISQALNTKEDFKACASNSAAPITIRNLSVVKGTSPSSAYVSANQLGRLVIDKLSVSDSDLTAPYIFFADYFAYFSLKPQQEVFMWEFTSTKTKIDTNILAPYETCLYGVVKDTSVPQTRIINSSIEGISCTHAIISSNNTEISADSLTLRHNSARRVMNLTQSATLQNLVVTENTVQDNLLSFLSSTQHLLISSSKFQSNAAPSGSVFEIEGSATLKAIEVRSNVCKKGCLNYIPASNTRVLSVHDSLWVSNTAPFAADIFFDINGNYTTKASFANTIFVGASASEASIMAFNTQAIVEEVAFKNCEFTGISLPSCKYCDERSAITVNFFHGLIRFDDCKFSEIKGASHVIDIKTNSPPETPSVIMERTFFTGIEAESLIKANYFKKAQYLKTTACTFEKNSGVIFNLQTSSLDDVGSTFKSNASSAALILSESASVSLEGSRFESNTLTSTGSCVRMQGSDGTFSSVNFFRNAVQFSAVVSLSDSSLTSELLSFEENSGSQLDLYVSQVKIDSLAFKANAGVGLMTRYVQGKLSQTECSYQEYCFEFESSTVRMNSLKFNNVVQQSIAAEHSSIELDGLQIMHSKGLYLESSEVKGELWTLSSVQSIVITFCKSFNLASADLVGSEPISIIGSTVHFEDVKFVKSPDSSLILQNSHLQIFNSTFTASQQSSIQAFNSTLGCSYCTFEYNQGKIGGALKLTNSRSQISNSSFSDNSAAQGGAIYWDDYKPLVENSTFYRNRALHGNDTASPASELSLSMRSLPNTRSGGDLPTLLAYIMDIENQVVTVHEPAALQIIGVNVTVRGITRVALENGKALFSGLQLYAKPGSKASLVLKSDGLPEQTIDLRFRDCIEGEELVNGDSCSKCANSTYSLQSNAACKQCPESAICEGGTVLYPKAGYWRIDEKSEEFYECVNPDNCLQGDTDNQAHNCKAGYTGPLCDSCANGYHHSNSRECSECPEEWINSVLIGLSSCLIVILLIVLVGLNIKNATKKRSEAALHFKLLVNYFQAIGLVSALGVHWPKYLFAMFQVFSLAGSSTQSLMSSECVIGDRVSVYANLIIATCLPMLLLVGALILWATVAWWKRNYEYLRLHYIATCIVILFLMLPSVTESTFSMLGCRDIDGSSQLVSDLNQECWEGAHLLLSLGVAVPAIFVWCLLCPGLVLYLVRRNRAKLSQQKVQIKYGYLFNGYKEDYFYWEFLVVFRKLCIKAATISFAGYSVSVQALAVLTILGGSAVLQQAFEPFERPTINKLEQASIVAAAATVICGLLFMQDLDYTLSQIVNSAAFIVNLYFLMLWVYSLYKATRQSAVVVAIKSRLSSLKKSISTRFSVISTKSTTTKDTPPTANDLDGTNNLSMTSSEFKPDDQAN